MKPHSLVLRALTAMLLLATGGWAHAEWAELLKDEDITYAWDKDSVRAVHVNRIAWTMTNLGKPATIYNVDRLTTNNVS